MAGWLSSKLKEAEQFLHQIDQQAAESLGKPEKQKPSVLSEERQGALHGKVKQTSDLPYANQDILRQASSGGKLEIGSQPAPSALSKLTKKSNHGFRALNGSARSEVKDLRSFKKKQLASVLQSAEDSEDNVRRDDWTELLASPNIDHISSPALASSVGSSDSGRTGFTKGASSRFASNAGKNGGGHPSQSDGFPSRNSSQPNYHSQVPSLTSKTKPSMSFFDTGSIDSSKATSPRRFRDETLRRRLELDLAGVGGDAEGVIKDAASATANDTGANGHSIDTNDAMTRRMSDFGELKHVSQRVVDETGREDGAVETALLETQREGHRKEWEQVPGTSPGSASEHTDHFAVMNPNLDLANESESEDSRTVNQSSGSKEPRADFQDLYEEVNELKEQAKSSVKTSIENGESLLSLVSEAEHHDPKVEGRELVAGDELGELEASPETQMLPASLESDVESYESGSMTETESDRETESEEDDEIERRKSAHKKRIARRKELAAIRAAAAQAAIREREVFVEKLEKEVVTLKHVLAEREEQQGRDAAELRLSIAEVLQALESEKKLYNSTRMEALAKESQLENQNADLAKSLGALQWELEEQMSQVWKGRSMVEAKEAIKADLERKLAKIRRETCRGQQNGESKLAGKANDEDYSFEEEQSDLWKKIQQCQIQVKDFEVKIRGLKDTQRVPTQTEMELENHLAQLTDHLIQKQAQVEALSTEKATLLIRLEAISNAIEEERAMASSQASRNKMGFRKNFDWDHYYDDMEHGLSRSYDSKTKSFAYGLGESSATAGSVGSPPLSPVFRQLNAVFSAGMFYLRRHRWAQAFAVVYIISLHLWVLFVLFMNSKPTQTLGLQELGLPKNVSELKDGSNITNLL